MRKQIIGAATLALLVGITGCKSVSVNSTPTGANARSGGQSLGTTPTTVEVNIFKSQKVSVSKDGYASKTVNVTFDSPNTINVSLDREFNIKSNPTGADWHCPRQENTERKFECSAMISPDHVIDVITALIQDRFPDTI